MEKILIFAFGMAIMYLLWKIINEMIHINKFISNIFCKPKKQNIIYGHILWITTDNDIEKTENEKIAEKYLDLNRKIRGLTSQNEKLERFKNTKWQYFHITIQEENSPEGEQINHDSSVNDFNEYLIPEIMDKIIQSNIKRIIEMQAEILELEKQVPFQTTKGGDYEIDSI